MKTTFIALLTVGTIVATIALIGGTPQSSTTPSRVYMVESVTKRGANKAVEFTWKDGGKSVSFSELTKGKVVLLNVWATWCGPCKRELPDIIAISNEMASKGVIVFGISLDSKDDRLQLVKSFSEKLGMPYVNVIDNLQIMDAYGGVQSIPTTFIIDRSGNIVQRIIGMQSKEAFTAALQKALSAQ